jgi:hypothetical protein
VRDGFPELDTHFQTNVPGLCVTSLAAPQVLVGGQGVDRTLEASRISQSRLRRLCFVN